MDKQSAYSGRLAEECIDMGDAFAALAKANRLLFKTNGNGDLRRQIDKILIDLSRRIGAYSKEACKEVK